tara:strand:- start:533 stop:1465 length:933 start_codon:yes stop_codon:yes gene_type:complete
MKNKKIKFLIYIIFYLFFLNTGHAKENKILFKIDNDIITSLDILNEIKYLNIINKKLLINTSDKEIFEIAKNSLVREKIKEIELLKHVKEIKIEEKYLDSILLGYFKEYKINSKLEFEKYFSNFELDPKNIEKKLTIEILWNQLIYQKFHKNIKINKDTIKSNILSSKNLKEYLLSEIFFDVQENENLDDKYLKIKNNINNSSFSEAALFFSTSNSANNGGDLGWIKETSIDKKILNRINSINVGEYTTPITVPGGFLILKINDIKISKIKNDTKKEFDLIVKKKTNDQLNQFSNVYFNKIKKNIQINEL